MDSFLHNIYEVCVDGLHFREWKHFLCIFIRFSSGMQVNGMGEIKQGGRMSVQEQGRKGLCERELPPEIYNYYFPCMTSCMQSQCSIPLLHIPAGVLSGTSNRCHRIIQSLQLEKTSKTTKSNSWPIPTSRAVMEQKPSTFFIASQFPF